MSNFGSRQVVFFASMKRLARLLKDEEEISKMAEFFLKILAHGSFFVRSSYATLRPIEPAMRCKI
tara:strand:- start:17095 stop:17289 length:195 start_codon:yes stop_codon:yes gene_type:complete